MKHHDAARAAKESAQGNTSAGTAGEDPRLVFAPTELEPAEGQLRRFFGEAYPTLARFRAMLAADGERLGLVGPREVGRLWSRHLGNCGAVSALVPDGAQLVDVGSGAGLPGIVVAAMRPDVHVELVEPMARRIEWLNRCVEKLSLDNATVTRARAEELVSARSVDVVTARAVAPLAKLCSLALPLLRPGGELLALKGARAEEEVRDAREVLRQWRASARVLQRSLMQDMAPTHIVVVARPSS